MSYTEIREFTTRRIAVRYLLRWGFDSKGGRFWFKPGETAFVWVDDKTNMWMVGFTRLPCTVSNPALRSEHG